MYSYWILFLFLAFKPGSMPVEANDSIAQLAKFVQEFYSAKNIHHVVALACDREGTRLLRSVSENTILKTKVWTDMDSILDVGRRNDPAHVLDGHTHVGVLVLLQCPEAKRVVEQCLLDSLFNASYHWLLVGGDVDLNAACLRTDTEMVLATALGPTGELQLVDVFRQSPQLDVELRDVGVWSPSTGFSAPLETRLTVKRPDIGDTFIRAGLYMLEYVTPDVIVRLHDMPQNETLKVITRTCAFGFAISKNIGTKYNMTLQYSSHTVPGALVPDEKGNFDGLMGAFQNKEMDVAFSGLFQYPGRMGVLHFPIPILEYRTMFVFLNPGILGSVDALGRPLSARAWAGVGVIVLTFFLLIRLAFVWDYGDTDPWSTTFITTFSVFTKQGFQGMGTLPPWRILLYTLSVFCLLAHNYYSSTIVTFLLQEPPTTIRNIHDLLKSPLKGASNDWMHYVRVFTKSTDPIVRSVYDSKVKPPAGLGFMDMDHGLEAIRYKHAAYYADDSLIYESVARISDSEICRLRVVRLRHPEYLMIPVSKHAPLLEYVRVGSVVQIERGLCFRTAVKWQVRKPICNRDSIRTTNAVSLEPVSPALVILASGIVLAAALCVLEIIRWKISRRQRKRVLGSWPLYPGHLDRTGQLQPWVVLTRE